MSILLLDTAVQQYAWGRRGTDSAVATLKREQMKLLTGKDDAFVVDAEQPYAELWIGTHPNAPSKVYETGQKLSEYVQAHPELVGAKVAERFGAGSLPFLLKVLSVNKALSIQAHPDKALAEKLHAERPDVYKDPNHKPEMTLALTPFEVLCGFRSPAEIEAHLASVPELRKAIGGDEAVDKALRADNVLRAVFSALMVAPAELTQQCVRELHARLVGVAAPTELEQTILRIHESYPGDVGVLCPYLLNHFTLQPGESLFLGPNEPHAYLAGNCIECMATSDNVVRAGLTPKLRDAATLVDMLRYEPRPPGGAAGEPAGAEGVVRYAPPVPDFQVERLTVAAGDEMTLPAHQGASVGLVVEGEGQLGGVPVRTGAAFFVAAGERPRATGTMTVYLATVNDSVFI